MDHGSTLDGSGFGVSGLRFRASGLGVSPLDPQIPQAETPDFLGPSTPQSP